MNAHSDSEVEQNRQRLLVFWLVLSSFGIMFAALSWLQEGKILPPAEELGFLKGVMALLSGLVLYFSLARKYPRGA